MPNIPNILTLSRIAFLPAIVAMFYLEMSMGALPIWIAFGLYVFVAITDFFDGWLARRWNQTTALGTFLDPIADKIFVGVMLVVLAAFGRLTGYWLIPALVIMAREFLISGLREYLGPHNIKLPVSPLAKWKTTVQMISLGFLILGPHFPGALMYGQWMLVFAAMIAVVTAGDYLKAGLDHMKKIP